MAKKLYSKKGMIDKSKSGYERVPSDLSEIKTKLWHCAEEIRSKSDLKYRTICRRLTVISKEHPKSVILSKVGYDLAVKGEFVEELLKPKNYGIAGSKKRKNDYPEIPDNYGELDFNLKYCAKHLRKVSGVSPSNISNRLVKAYNKSPDKFVKSKNGEIIAVSAELVEKLSRKKYEHSKKMRLTSNQKPIRLEDIVFIGSNEVEHYQFEYIKTHTKLNNSQFQQKLKMYQNDSPTEFDYSKNGEIYGVSKTVAKKLFSL